MTKTGVPTDMIDTQTSVSDTTDTIEPADFVDILKSPIPEESINLSEQGQLIEIPNSGFYQSAIERGVFTRDDLEALLLQEEKLQAVITHLVHENQRLSKIIKSKEDKILSSIEMIVSQKEWVHSLLDDNMALRAEIEKAEKDKLDTDAEAAFQIASVKNQKEELGEKIIALQTDQQKSQMRIVEMEEQIRKSAGALKNSQLHKNALSEKIEMMESTQAKYKIYLGLAGAAAAIFFSVLVVSWLNSEQNLKGKASFAKEKSSLHNADDNNILVPVNEEGIAGNSSPVEVTSDGFMNTSAGGEVALNNSAPVNMIDSNVVDDILETPINNAHLKRDTLAASDKNKNIKNNKLNENSSKSLDIASNDKGKKKITKTYVVQKSDTLYSISKKFYKSGNYTAKIKKDNNLVGELKPGQKIKVVLNEE